MNKDDLCHEQPEQVDETVSREGALQTNLLLAAADALSQYAIVPEYDCPDDTPEYVGEHCKLCGEMLTIQHEFSAHKDDCLIVLLTKASRSQAGLKSVEDATRTSQPEDSSHDRNLKLEEAKEIIRGLLPAALSGVLGGVFRS